MTRTCLCVRTHECVDAVVVVVGVFRGRVLECGSASQIRVWIEALDIFFLYAPSPEAKQRPHISSQGACDPGGGRGGVEVVLSLASLLLALSVFSRNEHRHSLSRRGRESRAVTIKRPLSLFSCPPSDPTPLDLAHSPPRAFSGHGGADACLAAELIARGDSSARSCWQAKQRLWSIARFFLA